MGAAHEGKSPLIGLGKIDERNCALIYLKKKKKSILWSLMLTNHTHFLPQDITTESSCVCFHQSFFTGCFYFIFP